MDNQTRCDITAGHLKVENVGGIWAITLKMGRRWVDGRPIDHVNNLLKLIVSLVWFRHPE
jgi:hypothetical protein